MLDIVAGVRYDFIAHVVQIRWEVIQISRRGSSQVVGGINEERIHFLSGTSHQYLPTYYPTDIRQHSIYRQARYILIQPYPYQYDRSNIDCCHPRDLAYVSLRPYQYCHINKTSSVYTHSYLNTGHPVFEVQYYFVFSSAHSSSSLFV